ncbi:putative O-linked N-acetylglucosamine transferase, SPINDLY family [Leptolyngbyaceae cyanobacterium JSC-12]|nr:putative O-linked N-acetylglucosamine transferase, SPINDLY family [Leptolyngbyaceae cyanobacterium JSC-12]
MPSSSLTTPISHSADQALLQGDYQQAAHLYEQLAEAEPNIKSHYWYLGVALLLQGQEAEAQTAWLLAMADGEPEEIEQWTAELVEVLAAESNRLEKSGDTQFAWVMRQHLREIYPNNIDNLLCLIQLSAQLEQLTDDTLDELGIIPALESYPGEINAERLLQTLQIVLDTVAPVGIVVDFTAACLRHLSASMSVFSVVLNAAIKIAYGVRCPLLSAHLVEEYCKLDPNNLEALWHLATFYQNARDYDMGIAVARSRLELVSTTIEQVLSNKLVLRGLMSAGGRWQESLDTFQSHLQRLSTLIAEYPTNLNSAHVLRLFNSPYFLPYFQDDLRQNRTMQNQVMQLCYANVQQYAGDRMIRYRSRPSRDRSATKRLKVGYLSHCMGQHSVGWLARWLLKYHDREQVELYGYFVTNRQGDYLHEWFQSQMDHTCRMGIDCADDAHALADCIYEDDLDILVDLDSITLDVTAEIMTLKPAPVQVTWLGWDAAGIPTIDYFIADPYVLPDWAQDYYPEKIWRLPQTYIAVDGFEVEVPNLRREDLDIPSDAIVYLSTQKGYKRHRETAKLQMRIIKNVPNSYFLIKGFADQNSIQAFFYQIAEEEGVNPEQLRFLPDAPSEAVHRANMMIADVVLDTFPYNGATTTLETLWMGVPLVTRVGEQFAARNSYTMLKNVGVEAGIAWTDEEYVEWGVRFGKDEALRQQVNWQLRQSRQTAPLWNGRQFAREMENAYAQMWANYLKQSSS